MTYPKPRLLTSLVRTDYYDLFTFQTVNQFSTDCNHPFPFMTAFPILDCYCHSWLLTSLVSTDYNGPFFNCYCHSWLLTSLVSTDYNGPFFNCYCHSWLLTNVASTDCNDLFSISDCHPASSVPTAWSILRLLLPFLTVSQPIACRLGPSYSQSANPVRTDCNAIGPIPKHALSHHTLFRPF